MPYEKLLELVEAKKLDITTVSLAEVTADFIKYVEGLQSQVEAKVLADFVAVAAKLILIKSKALLPDLPLSEEEVTDVKNLEARLLLYQQFRAAGENLKQIWRARPMSSSRPLLMNNIHAFYPPKNLNTLDLLSALANLSVEIKQLLPETQSVQNTLVSLEEKMEELVRKFNQQPQHQLQQLVANKSRAEIVVIFLAILHLLKQQAIKVDQDQWIKTI